MIFDEIYPIYSKKDGYSLDNFIFLHTCKSSQHK